jgi:hypothetical protein
MVRKQSFHGHDHAGRAVTALKSLMLEKRLLHRIERAAAGQTFDRDYASALGVCGKHNTRAHGPAVDQNRARTADPHATAFDRTLEQKIIAQALQQRLIRSH